MGMKKKEGRHSCQLLVKGGKLVLLRFTAMRGKVTTRSPLWVCTGPTGRT